MTWSLSDGTTTVQLDILVEWDQDQASRQRIVSTLGRDWDRVHHEGAGPLQVFITAYLKDTPAQLETRVHQLRQWRKSGQSLTLGAPGATYYDGLSPLMITQLSASKVIGLLNHREVSLSLVRKEE